MRFAVTSAVLLSLGACATAPTGGPVSAGASPASAGPRMASGKTPRVDEIIRQLAAPSSAEIQPTSSTMVSSRLASILDSNERGIPKPLRAGGSSPARPAAQAAYHVPSRKMRAAAVRSRQPIRTGTQWVMVEERISTTPVQRPNDCRENGEICIPIEFPTGVTTLLPEAMAALDQLGQALISPSLKDFSFLIEGHTDTVGTADYNHQLSQQRAEQVRNYLATTFGIPAERLKAVGLGSDHPVVMTAPQVAEPRNRRVQIIRENASS